MNKKLCTLETLSINDITLTYDLFLTKRTKNTIHLELRLIEEDGVEYGGADAKLIPFTVDLAQNVIDMKHRSYSICSSDPARQLLNFVNLPDDVNITDMGNAKCFRSGRVVIPHFSVADDNNYTVYKDEKLSLVYKYPSIFQILRNPRLLHAAVYYAMQLDECFDFVDYVKRYHEISIAYMYEGFWFGEPYSYIKFIKHS